MKSNITKNKTLLSLLLFIVTLSACTEKKTYTSKQVKKIIIDGTIDSLWSSVNWEPIINQKTISHYEDSVDFNVKFKSIWNNEGIYFLFSIKDDSLFDISKLKYSSDIPSYDETDCISIFLAYDSIRRIDFIRSANDTIISNKYNDIKCVIKKYAFNKILEIKIPWNFIIGDSFHSNIKSIPIEIYAFDNDNDATKGCFVVEEILLGIYKMHRTVLSWSEDKNEMNANLDKKHFGNLRLMP